MPPADPHLTFLRLPDLAPVELRAAPGLLSLQLNKNLRRIGLPALKGKPISISVRKTLVAHRGRLVSANARAGSEVYAAAFLRKRQIVLEAGLLSNEPAFRMILIHELFHFVWPRLGNSARQEFKNILFEEQKKGARGELGESSSVKKELIRAGGSGALWRDYVCESFCDTAAWLYSGTNEDALFTLKRRWRERRQRWFEAAARNGGWKC